MGKKIQVSISMDKDFIDELDKTIERYSLANRSLLIEKWARLGFKQLKKELRIPIKHEIAPEIAGKRAKAR